MQSDGSETAIRRVRTSWERKFAGGMIPFDVAYFAALGEGHTRAEACRAGVSALLDDFVAEVEQEEAAHIRVDLAVAAKWLRHIDRLDEIAGAKVALPDFNPLWDASFAMEQHFRPSEPQGAGHE
jgi:hypothetical protein